MSESLESQVKRLADFIVENIPGEPSQSEGAIDTAIRLLAQHAPTVQRRSEADRIGDAVQNATENPGRTVSVDDPWKGFPLKGDEVEQ